MKSCDQCGNPKCPGVHVCSRGMLDKYLTLELTVSKASNKLKDFPRLPNGLTPDVVKFSEEYRKAKQAYANAFKALQTFNKEMSKLR